ncbi:MAG TPA: chromosomal replication initiator protein DnaA [Candidatus Saccharimonadales bacterium]|nr:chromosomal replication initiator protein DnaA [Candidatus Saccharimonadales bacterium]
MKSALWQSVLGEIELSVSRASFVTWFKNTELIEETGGHVVIGVPNVFAKQQFEVKFNDQIRQTLTKNGVDVQSITYAISSNSKRVQRAAPIATDKPPLASAPQLATDIVSSVAPAANSNGGLNPRYTFDSFIVGSSNDLAYTACMAVAKDPGTKYNPLFLYGGVGLGKTHLMQAVGNEIVRHTPGSRILYTSTETFVNEFLDCIRYKRKWDSSRYRNVDVLIIDDMQFIAGKEKTQEEFFHTFNALHQANKQIIISSDKPPKAIPTLEERLRSRFEWGMAIDIQSPDFETRCAILQTKAQQTGLSLPRDTVEYLATTFQTNIRELEGGLNQLLAFCEMRGMDPDLTTAQGLLGNVRVSRPHHLTARQVIEKTAKHFQLEPTDITSPKRDKHIVVPRQIAMYLLRSELHLSFPKIASELGRKDHTTAIHSVEKIEKALKLDYIVRQQITEIRDKLYV